MNLFVIPPKKNENGMFTTTKTFICKQLEKLPPVVTDWQRRKEPPCSQYREGECLDESRQSASAPYPFDGRETPMVDSESVFFGEDWLQSWLTAPALPEKG